ncbi:hypothetical protein C5167_043754 [Papaver somniferum]|uniref:Pentacotripeptide-repeat region of PRORP domain-containing protein n=1 Tax=Papaver somniferum TaxID=3469 RepID=A0A4Y7L9J6_PAPSO|nr:hypothetical protein C5167_043754 [Papaver somniferum]
MINLLVRVEDFDGAYNMLSDMKEMGVMHQQQLDGSLATKVIRRSVSVDVPQWSSFSFVNLKFVCGVTHVD